jgi:hypothetical protein
MTVMNKPYRIYIVGFFAICMLASAVYGAFNSYSPVPYWDSWDILKTYMKFRDGDYSILWAQHNEHRVVIARLLFWFDVWAFQGTGIILIALNYLLVLASAVTYWIILQDSRNKEASHDSVVLLGLFITAWLFQWMQSENLAWTIQNQAFLAQLLPLVAFYLLYKSTGEHKPGMYFLIACIIGVISVGTQANGVLAMPLMAFYMLALYLLGVQKNSARIIYLALLSTILIVAYFYDYHSPKGHGNLLSALQEKPYDYIQYVLLYIGAPFYKIFDYWELARPVAVISACFLILRTLWLMTGFLRKPEEHKLDLAVVLYILYIAGTVTATAGGRLVFGVEQALASRYTTTSLMLWAAFFVLNRKYIYSVLKEFNFGTGTMAVLLMFFMGFAQVQSFSPMDIKINDQNVAALALALNIHDDKQIETTYPSVEVVLATANKAYKQNLAIFGQYPYIHLREEISQKKVYSAENSCTGFIDVVDSIDNKSRFVKITGWAFSSTDRESPEFIRFLDGAGYVVGYAITGLRRPDVAKAVDRKALYSGFRGYILSDRIRDSLTMHGERPGCQLNVKAPA